MAPVPNLTPHIPAGKEFRLCRDVLVLSMSEPTLTLERLLPGMRFRVIEPSCALDSDMVTIECHGLKAAMFRFDIHDRAVEEPLESKPEEAPEG